jgi:N-glycosylase/DNA lyase
VEIKCGDFNLRATLDSGQVFGFAPGDDGRYEGVLLGHRVNIKQVGDCLNIKNGNSPLSEDIVRHYFSLDHDLTEVYSILRSDEALRSSFEAFRGLRLIRQDSWEAIACFIISSNNNVKRIMGIYRNVVTHFGKFPTPLQIARSHESVLRELGLGYRASFLWATAKFLSTNPDYLQTICEDSYEEGKAKVVCFPGIGPKVADCVLLYGFHKLEAFPVDVWILRVMRQLYFKKRKISEDKVRRFGMKRWGAHAGYVQQYLFHSVRMGVYDIVESRGTKDVGRGTKKMREKERLLNE